MTATKYKLADQELPDQPGIHKIGVDYLKLFKLVVVTCNKAIAARAGPIITIIRVMDGIIESRTSTMIAVFPLTLSQERQNNQEILEFK